MSLARVAFALSLLPSAALAQGMGLVARIGNDVVSFTHVVAQDRVCLPPEMPVFCSPILTADESNPPGYGITIFGTPVDPSQPCAWEVGVTTLGLPAIGAVNTPSAAYTTDNNHGGTFEINGIENDPRRIIGMFSFDAIDSFSMRVMQVRFGVFSIVVPVERPTWSGMKQLYR